MSEGKPRHYDRLSEEERMAIDEGFSAGVALVAISALTDGDEKPDFDEFKEIAARSYRQRKALKKMDEEDQ